MAQKPEASEAVIAGTVFRDPGFAFPRVEITLTVTTTPPGKKAGKPRKASTDERGEFAFRVPAGAAKYSVRAVADGFAPSEQSVSVNADERVDVYITLKPLAK